MDPGETQQMKKRLHRIGQDRPVDYYITVAEHTIDEHLWEAVTAKQATLDAVLDGKTGHGTAADENSITAELAWRLTQQGLNGLGSPAVRRMLLPARSGLPTPGQTPPHDPHRARPRDYS